MDTSAKSDSIAITQVDASTEQEKTPEVCHRF